MVAVAIVGSAVVGAGASYASSKSASKSVSKAAAQNNALQTDIYGQNKAALAPFVGTGTTATSSINALLGLGGDTEAANNAFNAYKNSTEYTSRLNQGANSVTTNLGARGLLDSGAAQKSLLRYGQTFASNEFNGYLGNLQQQQQTGLAAASAQAGVGTNFANAVSTNNNNASNTAANAALSNGAAINGLLNNAVSAYAYSKGTSSSYGGAKGAYGISGSDGIY